MISRPLGSFKSSGKKGRQKGRKKETMDENGMVDKIEKWEAKKLFCGEDLGTLFKLGLGRLSRTMEQCTLLQRT